MRVTAGRPVPGPLEAAEAAVAAELRRIRLRRAAVRAGCSAGCTAAGLLAWQVAAGLDPASRVLLHVPAAGLLAAAGAALVAHVR